MEKDNDRSYPDKYYMSKSHYLSLFMRRAIAKDIARDRVRILIANALNEVRGNEKIAHQQAYLAKKIAMRLRVRLDYEIRHLFCKKCKQFIIPGKDSRIRIGRTKTKSIRITCLKCGHTYHKILINSYKDL
ncbi:MAG TPA: RNase P subunit [Candidatus Bathyarchaeia archaeon]|nr:RNase P subunit [Candidatus Bathyarchaeia archaeon]